MTVPRLFRITRSLGVLLFLGTAFPAAPADLPARPPEPELDLYAYGDTRGGLLARAVSGKELAPAVVHARLARALGRETPRGGRAVLFLGDAVSHAGCENQWTDAFYPALRGLCPTFCGAEGAPAFSFYPVIGDHEWKTIPRKQDERLAAECLFVIPLYQTGTPISIPKDASSAPPRPAGPQVIHIPAEPEKRTDRLPFSIMRQVDCRDWKEGCARILANRGLPPDDIRRFRCQACAFEEERFDGNFATYVFKEHFRAEAGFGPFQAEWSRATAVQPGASWYSFDRVVGLPGETARTVRVLMLDTMLTFSSRPEYQLGRQLDWIRREIRSLPPGSVLVVAGHEPPAIGQASRRLHETAIREALAADVRLAAVLSSHRHGFASGVFDVSHGGKTQRVLFVISGDGGGRDLGVAERPSQRNIHSRGRLGELRFRLVPDPGWFVDRDVRSVSVPRVRITPSAIEYGPAFLDLRKDADVLRHGIPVPL